MLLATWRLFSTISKKPSDIHRQLFLEIDEPLGDILGDLVGGFVLVEIPIEGLDPHIASVSDEVGYGVVGLVHSELDVGLHPRHTLGHGVGVFAVVLVSVKQLLDLVPQLLVLLLTLGQKLLQLGGVDVLQHVVDGLHPHFYPRVALAQQFYGILFNHVLSSLGFIIVDSIYPCEYLYTKIRKHHAMLSDFSSN